MHAAWCGFPGASHDVTLDASLGVTVLVQVVFVDPHVPQLDRLFLRVEVVLRSSCSLTESHLHSWPFIYGPRRGSDLSQAFTGPSFTLWSSSKSAGGIDTGRGVYDERVGKAAEAQKYGLGPLGAHVAVWVVKGAFHGQLVEDQLCEVHRIHAEVAASRTAPRSPAIGADVPHG